jgi:O-antigen ligase
MAFVVPSRRVEAITDRQWPVTTVVGLVVASGVVGLAMKYVQPLATLNAAVVTLAALWCVFIARQVLLAIMALAYVSASDVLWRMTNASVPWEFAKYLTIVIAVGTIARFVRRPRRIALPLLFLAVLVPGALITLFTVSLGDARDALSFDLAGPVAIACCVMMFRQLRATQRDASKILWMAVLPCISVATIALQGVLAAGTITFTGESNFATSGDFGPNQVSAVLGCGALLCLLLALQRQAWRHVVLSLGVGLWLIGQAFLTLSRGGVYAAVIGALGIAIAGVLTSGFRSKALTAGIVIVLGGVIIFSWLNGFSSGALENRYNDTGDTGRTEIASADVQLFWSDPLFGVGVGQSKTNREQTDVALTVVDADAASHTEYTRLLAEHGALGLIALVLLIAMAISGVRDAISPWNRFVAASLSLWTFAQFAHGATRVSITAFAFGVTSMRVEALGARSRGRPRQPASAS